MTTDSDLFSGKHAQAMLGLAVLCALFLASTYSYLLFHVLVEMFSIIVACGIFIIAWNSRRFMNNNYFLFLGIACFFIGAIDLLHTLAYKNMGVFKANDPNIPTQLWIAARYMQSISLMIAPLFLKRKMNASAAIICFTSATALLLAAIFAWDVFPDCFLEGVGLTPFKRVSEYVIASILCASLVSIRLNRQAFDREVMLLLTASFSLLIVSELAFTLYTDVFGISNKVGHFLKVAGFFFIYKALIEIGLTRPYDLLFRELKKSEEALLRERNDLKTANAELEAANTHLEAFNYTVSHDLRNPLANVSGSAQMLKRFYAEKLDEQGNEYIGFIQTESWRMDKLINTLLDFSRLTSQELQTTEVDLAAMAAEIAAELKHKSPDREVVFETVEEAKCWGDPALLRVVMDNLIGNAWKYTGNRESARIEFGFSETEGGQEYFVRDDGAGFDPLKAHKLFRPFQRLHKEEFEGLGVGLATVQRIIQRHGGNISAEGEAGKGAVFRFTVGGQT